MTDNEGTAKVAELAKDIRLGMLTTLGAEGQLISRPMALQDTEFDGNFWFFAAWDSRKIEHINRNPAVNVTLSSGQTWISVYGHASIVEDRAKAEQLWNSGVEAWFPQGPDSADIVLIRVDGDGAEYWDTPGGRVATVLSFAKAKVTGQPYDGGENEQVSLS